MVPGDIMTFCFFLEFVLDSLPPLAGRLLPVRGVHIYIYIYVMKLYYETLNNLKHSTISSQFKST